MQIAKYGFYEARFSAEIARNPFDVQFSVNVTCPDGTMKTVCGFYDGGNTFAFRFMPEAEGVYKYVTVCKTAKLNGLTGSFKCISGNDCNHGKVSVKNKFWFSYADGTPFFQAGTTCYAWIHQSKELRTQTLNTLSLGYFNKLRMCVFPKWYEYNDRQPELFPFEGSVQSGFDYDRLNVEFFRHIEKCVGELAALGIEADVILFHPYESQDWRFNYMTRTQDERYLRYIISRLSAYHNVWWSLANEYDLLKTGYKRKVAAWKRLIKFVHDNDPYGHPVSIHQLKRLFDHRNKYLSHCSIQRTDMYLTAEHTDTWREIYGKPVIIDECVYEGNLNAWWGGITAEELVRRFWEAAVRGGYLGHSETYYDVSGNIWWSHGGVLHGKSAERIKFLREVMDECPNTSFTSESGTNNIARAIAGTDTQLIYFGNYQPYRYMLNLLGGGKYRIIIIDTWNMEITELSDLRTGTTEIELPTKPFMAILCIAAEQGKKTPFTRDSVFEEMKLTSCGHRFLRLLKRLIPAYYSGLLQMTITQCSKLSGGKLDGKAGDGILRIANENVFWRGLWQIIVYSLFRRRR